MPGPLDKENYLARGPYPLEQSGEGNLWLGHMKPSGFHMPRQHMIVNLNFRSYNTQSSESFFCIAKNKELSGALFLLRS